MPDFLTVNVCAELCCFLAAAVCLRTDKSLIWKGQILYMAITCSVEIEGYQLKHEYVSVSKEIAAIKKINTEKKLNLKYPRPPRGNVWLYNILLVFQVVFISLMFYDTLKPYVNSKFILIIGLAVLGIQYAIDLHQHGVFEKHNNTTLAMSILFVVYSFYYYYHLIKDFKHYKLSSYAPFWWVTGSLFFFFGQIASTVLFQILSTIDIKIITTYTIYKILNVILYSCWSYSFICRKWVQKKFEIS